MNFSQIGLVVDAPENSPFLNATFSAIETIHSIDGKYEGSGFVEWTCTNGDKIYGKLVSTGHLGKYTSTVGDIVGGTGNCSGIQGSFDLKGGPSVKRSKPDTWQGYSVGTINWKIP